MFRSTFFALGIFLLILGAQTLVVSQWIMSYENPPPTAIQSNAANVYENSFRTAGYRANRDYYNQQPQSLSGIKPVYQTQEWMPWSLLAAGTIIVLYTYSTAVPK